MSGNNSLNEHRLFYYVNYYAPSGISDAFHRIISDRDCRYGFIIRTPVSPAFSVQATKHEALFLFHMALSLELSFQPTLISMHHPMLMVHSMSSRPNTHKCDADDKLCDHKHYRYFYRWCQYQNSL